MFCARLWAIIRPALALLASVHQDRPFSLKNSDIPLLIFPPTESSAEKRRMISPRIESA
ncbi:hypothetical protein D3C84_1161960 [compost metagenome]